MVGWSLCILSASSLHVSTSRRGCMIELASAMRRYGEFEAQFFWRDDIKPILQDLHGVGTFEEAEVVAEQNFLDEVPAIDLLLWVMTSA